MFTSRLCHNLCGTVGRPIPRSEAAYHVSSMTSIAPRISPRTSVLVVEDDADIRELVSLHLQLEGLTAIEAVDGDAGLLAAHSKRFDLIIVDLWLPGLHGATFCRAVRLGSQNAQTPILMLTPPPEESNRVIGLDSGADDYLCKPFRIRELLARVRALLRRGQITQARASAGAISESTNYKHIEIDPARRHVKVGSRNVGLTVNEFELLYVLTCHPGIVFSRESLLSKVWKDPTFVTVRCVDTLVKRLRQKLETLPAQPAVILTVCGAGYKAADV